MFKEVTEQDIADMFGISLEQCKKELADGIIECWAKQYIDMDIVDKFNSIPLVNPISANDLRKILGKYNDKLGK